MQNKMSPAQLQEYWDACLILGWRKFSSYGDVKKQWEAITGETLEEHAAALKRNPKEFFPHKTGIRVFVGTQLTKINERLLSQTPDKDVALLKKLQTSSYDTEKRQDPMNAHLATLHKQLKRNRLRSGFETNKVASRNHDTDWYVTK